MPPLTQKTDVLTGRYKLAEPVATSEHGRLLAPLRYLAVVERGYRIELGADAGYSGLTTRNPYKCGQTIKMRTFRGQVM